MIWPGDFISIILAVAFGAAIGMEREISGKSAGLRTNLLICLGAAVFTIISRQMVAGQQDSLTRIAAQIVTGVGFLGAGAIIQDRGGVLGLACGAGYYALAAITTLIAFVALLGLARLERALKRYGEKHKTTDTTDKQQ
ncbi:MAG: MgtC/SapB family protein [Planctomycetota bacterium]|jgi:putative Mg2+ transporter-C (MgtC) family protein